MRQAVCILTSEMCQAQGSSRKRGLENSAMEKLKHFEVRGRCMQYSKTTEHSFCSPNPRDESGVGPLAEIAHIPTDV